MEGQYNLRSPAVKRLMREAKELHVATSMYHAQPLEDNLFEWHFTVQGPKDTAFDGGRYHGRIILPPDYPMKPPSIIMLTPNGRFEVNRKICLSMSAYHPELWQPSWSTQAMRCLHEIRCVQNPQLPEFSADLVIFSHLCKTSLPKTEATPSLNDLLLAICVYVRTALLAIIGFMPSEGGGAIGSLDYTAEERRLLAKRSMEWVCSSCGAVIKDVLVEEKDDEQSKKMTTEAADVAAQMSFKSEEETKKAIKELKENVTKMQKSDSTEKECSSGLDKDKDISGGGHNETTIPAASTPSGDGLRRRNVKNTTDSAQQESETVNRPVRNDSNNVTSLLVLWALIFVIVMLAIRRLLYM